MPLLRKLVFALFFIAYLLVFPLTIWYALGYTFQPGDEQALVKTGLISLATTPPEASVFIGNRRYTSRTPTILRGLKPGAYPLRITLKGYRPWAETVSVEAEKATVLEKIILVPQRLQPAILLHESGEQLIPIPGTPWIMLMKGTAATTVVYNLRDGTHGPLIPRGSILQEAAIRSFILVEGSQALLVRAQLGGVDRTLWIALPPDENQVEDITDLLPAKPQQVAWEPRHRRHLFIRHNGAVQRIDVLTHTVSPPLAEQAFGFGIWENALYVLLPWALVRTDLDAANPVSLLDGPLLIRAVFGEGRQFRVLAFDRNAIVFLGERGELLAGRLPYRFVERGVRGVAWFPRRALIWQKDRLGLLNFTNELPADALVQPVPEFHWLFKQGRDIEQAFWAYDGSHVVFRDDDRVLLLAADPSGASQPEELVRVKPGSAIAYDEETAALAYVDRATGHLARLTLFERPWRLSFQRASP